MGGAIRFQSSPRRTENLRLRSYEQSVAVQVPPVPDHGSRFRFSDERHLGSRWPKISVAVGFRIADMQLVGERLRFEFQGHLRASVASSSASESWSPSIAGRTFDIQLGTPLCLWQDSSQFALFVLPRRDIESGTAPSLLDWRAAFLDAVDQDPALAPDEASDLIVVSPLQEAAVAALFFADLVLADAVAARVTSPRSLPGFDQRPVGASSVHSLAGVRRRALSYVYAAQPDLDAREADSLHHHMQWIGAVPYSRSLALARNDVQVESIQAPGGNQPTPPFFHTDLALSQTEVVGASEVARARWIELKEATRALSSWRVQLRHGRAGRALAVLILASTVVMACVGLWRGGAVPVSGLGITALCLLSILWIGRVPVGPIALPFIAWIVASRFRSSGSSGMFRAAGVLVVATGAWLTVLSLMTDAGTNLLRMTYLAYLASLVCYLASLVSSFAAPFAVRVWDVLTGWISLVVLMSLVAGAPPQVLGLTVPYVAVFAIGLVLFAITSSIPSGRSTERTAYPIE